MCLLADALVNYNQFIERQKTPVSAVRGGLSLKVLPVQLHLPQSLTPKYEMFMKGGKTSLTYWGEKAK